MRVFALLCVFVLVGTIFTSLLSVPHDMHAASSSTDCPFMVHEEVWCPMNLAEHIEAWRDAFLAVLPPFLVLLFMIGCVAFCVATLPAIFLPKWVSLHIRESLLRERTYTFYVRPLQQLFSDGILHPKLFNM